MSNINANIWEHYWKKTRPEKTFDLKNNAFASGSCMPVFENETPGKKQHNNHVWIKLEISSVISERFVARCN